MQRLFTGEVLNQPVALRKVREGDRIQILVPGGSEYPILTTGKYLQERPGWTIHACPGCGLSELFDAPSDLIRAQFPDAPPGAEVEAFTVMCPLCGGVVLLERRAS